MQEYMGHSGWHLSKLAISTGPSTSEAQESDNGRLVLGYCLINGLHPPRHNISGLSRSTFPRRGYHVGEILKPGHYQAPFGFGTTFHEKDQRWKT